MILTIRYTDLKDQQHKTLEVECAMDVVSVTVPPQPHYNGLEDVSLPGFTINVNSDAVIIENDVGHRLAMLELSDFA